MMKSKSTKNFICGLINHVQHSQKSRNCLALSRTVIRSTSNRHLSKLSSVSSVSSSYRQISLPSNAFPNSHPSQNILRSFSSDISSYPNHVRVKLPSLSPTMTTGTIIAWQANVGDEVAEGDLLCEIETDKATMGFETPEEGFVARIFLEAGSKDVPLGTLMCLIVENREDIDKFNDYPVDNSDGSSKNSTESEKDQANQKAALESNQQTGYNDGEVRVSRPPVTSPSVPLADYAPSPAQINTTTTSQAFASPAAKLMAKERGVDISGINAGTGMDGMITSQDVIKYAESGAAAAQQQPSVTHQAPASQSSIPAIPIGDSASFTDTELSSMRKTIASRLQASKMELPHYYLTVECQVDKLIELRKQINSEYSSEGIKLSVNDFLIKAMALSSLRVPQCNSAWMDTFIRQYNTVDVSVAVDTGSGLITPIVKSAHILGLSQISMTVKELAERAKAGKLQPHEFVGGTITISNLGMFGINNFTAIINPPQSCILAVGGLSKKLVEVDSGVKSVNTMKVTLSCDHRVVDGAVGAQWLQHFKRFMENPSSMLL